MNGLRIGIAASADRQLAQQAKRLAGKLGLPLVPTDASGADALLLVTDQGLALQQQGKGVPGPVRIDFARGRQAHRRQFGGGRGQPLARAVGLKRGRSPNVLDATAGLGRDAFVLASLGCRVDLIERSPIIAALLDDALERASCLPELKGIISRMCLHQTEGSAYIERLSEPELPDVIYLDPMYPHRRKSALVKKEMRLFQLLLGDDDDAGSLLALAQEKVRYRVVVKRPVRGDVLGGVKPDSSISSPNTRYDIYINRGFDSLEGGRGLARAQ